MQVLADCATVSVARHRQNKSVDNSIQPRNEHSRSKSRNSEHFLDFPGCKYIVFFHYINGIFL